MTNPRALVVDDEPQMLDIVTFALETQGFEAVGCGTAEAAWQLFAQQRFDLLILDVMLPHSSGLVLCRRIRETSEVPIILLTARGESSDRVEGFEVGADDYVTKPFHPRELALRAEALVRRTMRAARSEVLVHGPLRVDGEGVSVRGRNVILPEIERRLLDRLMRGGRSTVAFDDLLLAGWQQEGGPGSRAMLKTTVYRLRRHLAAAGLPDAIEAVRSRGYRLRPLPPV